MKSGRAIRDLSENHRREAAVLRRFVVPMLPIEIVTQTYYERGLRIPTAPRREELPGTREWKDFKAEYETLRNLAKIDTDIFAYRGAGDDGHVMLREWFERPLFNLGGDEIVIPVTVSEALEAGELSTTLTAQGLRSPLSPKRLGKARTWGLFVEIVVRRYADETWPGQIIDRTHYGHDFRLRIGSKISTVDVASRGGEKCDERYGGHKKKSCAYHWLAYYDESKKAVVLEGTCSTVRLIAGVNHRDQMDSISQLVLRLNCAKIGLDFDTLKSAYREDYAVRRRRQLKNSPGN